MKSSDGKYYNTDVVDIEGMFRLIESIPSKNAESLIEYFDKVSIQFSSNNPQANLDKGIENIIKHKELRYLKRIKEKK